MDEKTIRNALRGALRSTQGLALLSDLVDAKENSDDPVWIEDSFIDLVIQKGRDGR